MGSPSLSRLRVLRYLEIQNRVTKYWTRNRTGGGEETSGTRTGGISGLGLVVVYGDGISGLGLVVVYGSGDVYHGVVVYGNDDDDGAAAA